MLKFILIILDGFGLRKEKNGNAIANAFTPNLDQMSENCPVSSIETSGLYVGLPDGIMGNSEVGHMNIGAGRIIKQDLVRINDSIHNNKLRNNNTLLDLFNYVKNKNSVLHMVGLVSDGGVHSHIEHFKYIINAARDCGLEKICIHAITDGRDTSPTSSIKYLNKVESYIRNDKEYKISSISGRYYAMDRDNRWDRIKKAYDLYINGIGEFSSNWVSAIKNYYDQGITDEFILPTLIGDSKPINNSDAVIMMNFRADRMRQIVSSINQEKFSHFKTKSLDIFFGSMVKYHPDFKFPVLFQQTKINNTFPEILSKNHFRQLRIAETEKYAHVTYFFNGGEEKVFKGESRKLIPSPKVATYDLKPEMSAKEVTSNVVESIMNDNFEAIILNYANPDMVGHTGNLQAAIKAIEVVDQCLGRIRIAVKNKNSAIFLTADHGNLEMMVDEKTNEIHTAHTTLPVPLMLESDRKLNLKQSGKLADIAPTILDYLEIRIPDEMTGESLLIKEK